MTRRRPDISLSPQEITDYLEHQRIGVLATNGRDGFPHQMPMWYVTEKDRVLMWTYARSQKVINLRRDPRASFVIDDGETYATLRGVLLQGTVELITEPSEVTRVGVRLRLRYNPGSDIAAAREDIERQAPKRVIIALAPTKIMSWDHRKLG